MPPSIVLTSLVHDNLRIWFPVWLALALPYDNATEHCDHFNDKCGRFVRQAHQSLLLHQSLSSTPDGVLQASYIVSSSCYRPYDSFSLVFSTWLGTQEFRAKRASMFCMYAAPGQQLAPGWS
jgi:hypothetical protein